MKKLHIHLVCTYKLKAYTSVLLKTITCLRLSSIPQMGLEISLDWLDQQRCEISFTAKD